MHVRRRIKPLMAALTCAAAVAACAVAAAPALAGTGSGTIRDQFGNPLGGIHVDAVDYQTEALLGASVTSDDGSFSYALNPVESGWYKVRVTDPAGIFTTSYLYGQPTFQAAELIGYS